MLLLTPREIILKTPLLAPTNNYTSFKIITLLIVFPREPVITHLTFQAEVNNDGIFDFEGILFFSNDLFWSLYDTEVIKKNEYRILPSY